MSADPITPYAVFNIEPAWVLETEAMGSKRKFWYRADSGSEWLFKFPQPNTGQHWAEKIVAEIAAVLDILHAKVELAVFQGERGSATESFARDGRELFHGNQLMAGQVLGYDPGKRFGQAEHTLDNILLTLNCFFATEERALLAKQRMASYLLLDALVGNTDRHHENWGILRKRTEAGWFGVMAPTFDHASSLGRELVDDSRGKCRRRLLAEDRVGEYAERASGAIFWRNTDRKGLSPLDLVRRSVALHPALFAPGLKMLEKVEIESLQQIVLRVPAQWMSDSAREFAVALMRYTLAQLRSIGT